jgi:hypothetical protein
MGVVDLARDEQGNRVAMKRLTLHGSASEILQARQRLLREASVLRRLHHPNVVRLLDVVEDGDEIVLVMPFLPGGNLAERVSQHGPAPAEEVERLGERLLGAIAEAHGAGVIHRDIKPANVLFDEQGDPCLADFGLAHTWDQTQGLTVSGMVVGTPGFMSPEQTRDEPLTPATDIFSLGATLLFATTGQGPFGTGDPGLLMVRAASGKIEKVPKSVPSPLRRRISAMLDPKPERRPTAVELLSRREVGPRPRTWATVAGGAGVAALALGMVFVATRGGDTDGGVGDDATDPPDGAVTSAPVGAGPTTSGPAPTGGNGDVEQGFPDSRDELDGRELVDEIEATLSQVDSADSYPVPMGGGEACPREITLVLTAPPGLTMQLQVYQGEQAIDAVNAAGNVPGEIVLRPDCREGAVNELSARVTTDAPPISPTSYILTRIDN